MSDLLNDPLRIIMNHLSTLPSLYPNVSWIPSLYVVASIMTTPSIVSVFTNQ